MSALGSPQSPLRVAIIGSGPSGFYAAEHLLKHKDLSITVDMFDRLPTPFGLVRGGVAPDHQKIKSVTKVYEKTAANPNFRFFGHVEFGKDLSHADLAAHYHAIIYAVGAQTDKSLGIPGEHLPGSHAATEFVAWYNGHPDYKDCSFNLDVDAVAIIGVGNVAMDVTRILARSQNELNETDIADYAQAALAHSRIKTIYVLGRRGVAQAAFTNPEIKELGEMEEADIIALPEEVALDEVSRAYLGSGQAEAKDAKNAQIVQEYAARAPEGKPKRIVVRFLVSPVEILGDGKVEAIRIVKNKLVMDDKGNVKPVATEESETLPVGLVFRSVGYMGVPLPDVPFDAKRGIIPNEKGRVVADGQARTGDYVVGWIKRGPSGIIGTNKPDSIETADMLLEDARNDALLSPTHTDLAAIPALLAERGVQVVTFADWQYLDGLETSQGAATGRPRVKFTDVDAMLKALQTR